MAATQHLRRRGGLNTLVPRLVARTNVLEWAARLPFGRGMARRDGAEIFDVLQGFVSSQVLSALVELDVFSVLLDGPATAVELSRGTGIAAQRMETLLQAGAALGFLVRRRSARFGLTRKGAAVLGVPGLADMIRHNRAFYRDFENPVDLLRGDSETEMARFWPYVFGGGDEIPSEVSERYSDLMARSQVLVAQDTLRMVRFSGIRKLMDIGGGTGVFLSQVLRRHKKMQGVLFDLPGVMPLAKKNLSHIGMTDRVTLSPGSFRDDQLPTDVDAISLVRVLYDHDDDTVKALVARVFDALPPGGRLIVSEPMSGGRSPDRVTDVFFAFYTMAMQTGRTRSAEEISTLCRNAGFIDVKAPRAPRPYITGVLTARKPN
ncbi:methyltransferase [Lutimaribacter marinistellae]|uniref:Methyltransferase n=1 Tax=Lutimaribacter marinistellae TaxID=1820329 RepID=A0ABV7TH76_9RHOB